jgi:hypothetical protein
MSACQAECHGFEPRHPLQRRMPIELHWLISKETWNRWFDPIVQLRKKLGSILSNFVVLRGYLLMVKNSGRHPENVGSIPTNRSNTWV